MKLENFMDATESMTREDLVKMLYTDALTLVWNRRAFDDLDHPGPMAIVDLDSLKWINEALGHRNGDAALAALAQVLEARFPGNVYRLGGDEFVVVAGSREALLAGLLLAQGDARSVYLENESYTCRNAAAFSFGIGGQLDDADLMLREDKMARESVGARACRGELPPGVAARLRVVR